MNSLMNRPADKLDYQNWVDYRAYVAYDGGNDRPFDHSFSKSKKLTIKRLIIDEIKEMIFFTSLNWDKMQGLKFVLVNNPEHKFIKSY